MRLIDADALYETFSRLYDSLNLIRSDYNRMDAVLSDMLTIDAVPVVRCGECKWADWDSTKDGNRYCYCMETGIGGMTEDDYCSYGERKDGAE